MAVAASMLGYDMIAFEPHPSPTLAFGISPPVRARMPVRASRPGRSLPSRHREVSATFGGGVRQCIGGA